MKNAITFTFFSVLILVFTSSCAKTDEQIARDTIESYIKENMNDPSSYEFVKMDSINQYLVNF